MYGTMTTTMTKMTVVKIVRRFSTLPINVPKQMVVASSLTNSQHRCTRNYSHKQVDKACPKFDIVVIGGGIVGAASAREMIIRHPNLKIALLEKEYTWAKHQSTNNSGVIHAGIYYKPGSLKAKLCVQGLELAYKYFDEHNIKYNKCGKLIVATKPVEVPRLLDLYDRGIKNGVKDLKLVEGKDIPQYEPHCRGLQAIWSPHTGIVSWGVVTHSYVEDFVKRNGKSYLNFEVKRFAEGCDPDYPVRISDGEAQDVYAKYVLTCCGLHSDTVALLTGCPEEPKIIPFRGEYLYLVPKKSNLVKSNIYPVPDPRFPFLGVHFTPRIDGRVILGPNAILAFCKEGYKYSDISLKELKDIITFSGFRKLAAQYAGFGIKQISQSVFYSLQVKELQQYIQKLTNADVERGPAGVRAQAMGKDGSLIEDFVFDSTPGSGLIGNRVLHCRNAPSPGATSSLAIAIMIADKMEDQFKLKG